MSITLRSCMLTSGEVTDVSIKDGVIHRIGKSAQFTDCIDAGGKLILPGIIDAHVHLRDFEEAHKEDWISGTKAALHGGVTTVLDMPNNRPPVIDRSSAIEKTARAGAGSVNFAFHLGATVRTSAIIREELKGKTPVSLPRAPREDRSSIEPPIVSLKVYLGSSTGDLLLEREDLLDTIFSCWEGLFTFHAEDEATIRKNLAIVDAPDAQERHELVRSREASLTAIRKVLERAARFDRRVHICHVSTQEEITLIRAAKESNLKVSCEVTPHHLFLCRDDAMGKGNLLKVNPPLRTRADQDALWTALLDGTIDMIASDHAPHHRQEKLQPYEKAPSGLPGLETTLPLVIDRALKDGAPLGHVSRWLSENPARVFALERRGLIEEGYAADLVVVDLNETYRVAEERLQTKVRWSPFAGRVLRGWPIFTIVGGEITCVREA